MNQGGDAAEQIVRMSLNGAEVALKLTGAGAKELTILLASAISKAFSGKKVRGKTRLKSMLKNEKSLKVFAVNDKDLKKFCKEAKKYGVLYCVLKNKKAKDGMTDILVRGQDAAKINRIFERFNLASVNRADVENQVERNRNVLPMKETRTEKDTEAFLDRLTKQQEQTHSEHKRTRDPSQSRGRKPSPSERTSEAGKSASDNRPSVRQELYQIRADREMARRRKVLRERYHPGKQKDPITQQPKIKINSKKGRSR